jgi:hypothetical protein
MQDPSTGTTVNVPFPEGGEPHLRISVGACRLRVRPGDGDVWVTGSYHDPTTQVPLRIERDNRAVRLSQGVELRSPPAFLAGVPSLDLVLGNARPYQLTVETGASENVLDLGGLPITRLAIRFGAGKTEVDFSKASPHPMAAFEVAAGAGSLDLHLLAHVNAAEIRVEGGAAAFRLDFEGSLQRDVEVRISTGLSSTDLVIPPSTAAKVTSESVLGGVDVGDGWMKTEGQFWNRGALDGATPTITVRANVALGALMLR